MLDVEIVDFMSLEVCRDDPSSPHKALMAVDFLVFTVYVRALFSYISRSVMYFFY